MRYFAFLSVPYCYKVLSNSECHVAERQYLNVLEFGAVPAVSQSCAASLPVLVEGDGPQRYENAQKHCSSIIKQDARLQKQEVGFKCFCTKLNKTNLHNVNVNLCDTLIALALKVVHLSNAVNDIPSSCTPLLFCL